ncbi:fimbrial protein [Pluralibacter sp.]|uniref:fimbrial protein n=1 Tax=Pluralibacter sp. TaxID=1920032 RepID=UPI0025CBE77D|nr:fimbrial protein [Pluralibacter sp.]MBV8044836.1 fimbrial protein [Pluralibacter sp.]
MKHNIVFAFCFCGVFVGSPAVRADDSGYNLKLTGTIVAETCNVDASSETQTVKLGQFSTADFPSVGSTATSAPLLIMLTGCTQNITDGQVWFTGTADSDDPSLLALSATGMGTESQMATGVGVQILDSSQSPVSINNTASALYPLHAGDNTLTFNLRYKSTTSQVTAGNATAVMYFDLQYQ